MTDANPLVDLPFAIPFDRIAPEHVVPGMQALLARADGQLQAIRDAAATPTWDTTLGALEAVLTPVGEAWTVVEHLRAVCHSEALDAAHGEVLPEVTDFFSGISLDEGLYAAIRAYAATDEAGTLTGVKARHLERTLDEFRKQGAELAPEAKQRFKAIASELAKLGSTFGTHVVEATAAWSLDLTDEAQLAGLPDAARAMAKASAEAAGVDGWRFTLQAPSVIGVLTHLDDRGVREQVWRAYNGRCTSGERDNGPVIARMLELRREQAKLLGFTDFSDYVLSDRMARTGETAATFLAELEAKARPWFDRESAELAEYATGELGLDALQPWDVGWVSEKLRKARYDLDEEALRPYFAFPRVRDGLFTLVHRLYGVTIQPTDLPVWHDEVETFEVLDADGTRIGAFYMDFFPRDTKRGGAWMNPLLTGGPQADGTFTPHLGLICGNVTPPSGGQPALLTHREVETLFHEFGHLLHHLLTTVPIPSRAGTNVAWDFVELPSQIMENWCWQREALDLFATHVDTGEPLPDALFERMVAARNFRAGSFLIRQLGFGTTDLALHRTFQGDDPVAWGKARMDAYAPVPTPDDATMLTSFLHLFSSPVGYAAGYYSYLWAEVLDADAFTRFENDGLFDRATGEAFRTAILSRGDSAAPDDLFRAFMGRDPDPEALLRRRGLTA